MSLSYLALRQAGTFKIISYPATHNINIAEHLLGMKVEERDVYVDRLDEFKEAGACGTAAVISPIGGIQNQNDFHVFYSETEVGPITQKLYELLTAIQFGDIEGPAGWVYDVFE